MTTKEQLKMQLSEMAGCEIHTLETTPSRYAFRGSCSWLAVGRKSDGSSIEFHSFDTMTKCVREGFLLFWTGFPHNSWEAVPQTQLGQHRMRIQYQHS